MNDSTIERLRALAMAATAGPWGTCPSGARPGVAYVDVPTGDEGCPRGPIGEFGREADAAFAAAADPPTVLGLLDRLERVEAGLAKLKAATRALLEKHKRCETCDAPATWRDPVNITQWAACDQHADETLEERRDAPVIREVRAALDALPEVTR